MPSLGPKPRATGLLNCILKPTSVLSRKGISCLAAGMVTQLPLNLGKGAEDRGRCLPSSSSSRHPTLSANRLRSSLSSLTQSLGRPCLGFSSQPRQPFFFPTHCGCEQKDHRLELWVLYSCPSRHGPSPLALSWPFLPAASSADLSLESPIESRT